MPFHPYYTAKDGFGAGIFLIGLTIFTFFIPNYLGHPVNYVPANPLSTPAHIVPEWYFWPYYAILRAFTVDFILPAKLWGVLAMFASILLLFFLPWLDKSPVRSGNYLPTFKIFFWILILVVAVLGYCGGMPAEEPFVMISQVATMYYFAHFLIILPLLSMVERTLPLPNSISESVLHGEEAEAVPIGVKPATAVTNHMSETLMVRFFGFVVGLGFVAVAAWSLLWGAIAYIGDPPEVTVEHRFHEHPRDARYTFDGPFGRYDRQQLQRGFQVYKEVCASCHSLSRGVPPSRPRLYRGRGGRSPTSGKTRFRRSIRPPVRRRRARRSRPTTSPAPISTRRRRGWRTTMRCRRSCR